TPIKAMAQVLDSRGVEFQLHYAGRRAKEMAFLDRLQREFGARLHTCLGDQQQRLDIEQLLQEAPKDAMVYLCGPEGLIGDCREAAHRLGINPSRLRFEQFQVAAQEQDHAIEVLLKRSDRTVQVAADQTILDALLEQDIAVPFGCKAGNCRSCVVKVLEGEAEHRDSTLTNDEHEKEGLMTPCVSRSCGDRLVLDL
ncbi:MAG: iron-sulfur cluster-binding domain-containing protein, partial [Motiliproteus sp.]|nr:iron-sulfur cluster-binding domain-containing protein [Motiliproteus sp.]